MWKVMIPLIVVVAMGCSQNAGTEREILYRTESGEKILVFKLSDKSISNGHIAQPLEFCDATFFCVKSAWITLSVIKSLEPKSNWQLENWTFEVLSKDDSSKSMIYKIRGIQKEENIAVDYAFTFSTGIQSIEIQSSGEKALYKLVGACGLGATACGN